MYLSTLRVHNLLSSLWYLALVLSLVLNHLQGMAHSTTTSPFLLGRVKSHSTLFEDISTPTMEIKDPSQKGFTLHKAYTPSVDFNVEILCKWKSFFRIRILAGENTYLISEEDLLFLGENMAQLNDKVWRLTRQNRPKAIGLDEELLEKIETCVQEDTLFSNTPNIEPEATEPLVSIEASEDPLTRGEVQPKNKTLVYGLHKVREGESLKSIADSYQISVMDILSINELGSELIKIGQMLRIPRNPQEEHEQVAISYHEVKEGETLWRIATFYAVDLDQLKRLNKLQSNTIYHGQKLAIPTP